MEGKKSQNKYAIFILLLNMYQIFAFAQPSSVLISSQQSVKNSDDHNSFQHNKCEPIQIPLCQDLNLYNKTIFPNLLGHSKQDEGEHSFLFIFEKKFSHIRFFI